MSKIVSLLTLLFVVAQTFAQTNTDSVPTMNNSAEKQYPGLGKAASGVFYSEKPWSVTGFGEMSFVNFVHSQPNKAELGDLELYYSSLYRLTTFFGYRFSDKIILNSEIMIEHLRSGPENHTYFIPELFMDFRLDPKINIRAGILPVANGYINSNDEPILFYSVNRPEVERLIIPSTWMAFGAMAYGNVTDNLSYLLGVTSGLNANEFRSGTWIRGGNITYDFKSLALSPQLLYRGIKNTELGLSAFWGSSKLDGFTERSDRPFTQLYTLHGQWRANNWRITALATTGAMSNTDNIYNSKPVSAQVIGSRTFGYYFELGYDILDILWQNRSSVNGLYGKVLRTDEMILPVFFRYERLDTHSQVLPSLKEFSYNRTNMHIYTLGFNYNITHDFAFKFNYQFRKDVGSGRDDIVECGIGFNF
ncbi:porin [Prolixibacteraceae bacterium Z1-6]|uniref:Porin n=1 Tax=Draconibacterium aestuarii TaxID=2998507 RepID=A0A9X3J855_9BACT|nr:porin [Prolixibacteraceae bacterium Z1-6]